MTQSHHNSNEPKIIGQAYKDLKEKVKKFAQNDFSVLLIGEPGTGKELFAQLYKAASKRKGDKQTINCAAFPDELLRSEVFGHVAGAFTGAIKDRKGSIDTCKDGILFLDELGDASENFQAAILRVVEQNSFSKLGGDEEIKDVNTLIIAATNKPQSLRQDLKDRFNLLFVPPLQKIDIQELVKHFLKKPIKPEYLKELLKRDYPGNVRELRRVCETLKAEKGNDIFCKKSETNEPEARADDTKDPHPWNKPKLVEAINKWRNFNDNPFPQTEKEEPTLDLKFKTFEYDRFSRESDIWQKYIQPIIEKTAMGGIKYKYTDPGIAIGQQGVMDSIDIEDYSDYLPNLANDILEINSGVSNKSPESIINRVEGCINAGYLPLLLNSIKEVKEVNDHFDFTITPKLFDLLKTVPPKAAREQFLKTYFEYHLSRYNGNRKKTAKALSVPLSTLKSALSRLGIKETNAAKS
jgi:DNA-binding NtrC family response regulator